ncbi:MAG TPA: hypothetical protein VGO91_03775 [Pyrinomonadaceae bacterium]|jgi:ElaB/YqjD/DUF883 family membrane-anchored ribosome-binding protein|nr:hypothetical protein [Pyrinomonadaceae bacterium]
MSQNKPTSGPNEGLGGATASGGNHPTGGAGTGATDAGTTRASSGSGTSGSGTTGGSGGGSGQSLATSAGAGGGQGGGTATAGIAATAQEYGQRIADAASTAKDYVSDKVAPVVDKIKDIQNVDINEVANQAKDYARQNPGQAMLISAAAGMILGLLIRSGSRR